MVFRALKAAPASRLPPERRGGVVGHFCSGCSQIYALQRRLHTGDPILGRDHVASPCPYEGWPFEPGVSWWEPAVEVLPASPAPPLEAARTTPAAAGAPPPSGPASSPQPAAPAAPQTLSAPQQGQPAPAPPKG